MIAAVGKNGHSSRELFPREPAFSFSYRQLSPIFSIALKDILLTVQVDVKDSEYPIHNQLLPDRKVVQQKIPGLKTFSVLYSSFLRRVALTEI